MRSRQEVSGKMHTIGGGFNLSHLGMFGSSGLASPGDDQSPLPARAFGAIECDSSVDATPASTSPISSAESMPFAQSLQGATLPGRSLAAEVRRKSRLHSTLPVNVPKSNVSLKAFSGISAENLAVDGPRSFDAALGDPVAAEVQFHSTTLDTMRAITERIETFLAIKTRNPQQDQLWQTKTAADLMRRDPLHPSQVPSSWPYSSCCSRSAGLSRCCRSRSRASKRRGR